jgi:integrase
MTKRSNGEGTYLKRPESEGGGYLFRIRINGQRVSGSGATRKIAKDRAMERARTLGDRRGRDTVEQLATEWSGLAPSVVGLKPTTADQYRSVIRARILPRIGAKRVDALTRRDIADLFPADDDSPPSTQRSKYAALVRLLDYAVDRGLVAVNVAREVKRPAAAERRSPRQVDVDAVRRFLQAADQERLEIAAWLGFGCGLRRGEILGLTWADVDFDRAVLSVTGNVTRSSVGLVRGTPKTRRGQRNVPIPANVVDRLKAHRKRQVAEQLAAGLAWRATGAVLTNEVGGYVEPRELSRRWHAWAIKAGLADRGTHVGRHYAAATLLASGAASVADVAAQMGHDPAVLLNVYAVAVASGQRAASDVLGASLTVPITVPTRTK